MPQYQTQTQQQTTAWAHSYGKQVLESYGYKLYAGNTRIMADDARKHYVVKPLRTSLVVGENIAEEPTEEQYSHISIERLKHECGLTITPKPAGNLAWRSSQRVYWCIQQRRPGTVEISSKTVHTGHYVEHDEFNKRVRGVGERFADSNGKTGRGKTSWVYYDRPHQSSAKKFYAESAEELINEIKGSWVGKEYDYENLLDIPETSVLITRDNYLLCLPKTKSPQKILLVGETGFGKSFGLNSLGGRIRYIFKDAVIVLNDILGQFHEMGVPNNSQGQVRILNRIGNQPMPLPTINLYMSAPDIKFEHPNEGVDFRLVIPLYDFIDRYEFWTAGVRDWQFSSGTDRYLKESRDELAGCRDAEEIKAMLYAKFGGEAGLKKDSGRKSMITKMHDTFAIIFKNQFTDNLFINEQTTSPIWKLETPTETYEGPPAVIAAYAGLVPVIITKTANRLPHFRNAVADIINQVYDWQRKLGEKKRRRIWVLLDEMQTVYEIGKRKDNAAEALENVFRQGRFLDIGFIANTQNYARVHEDIKDNVSHLLCVNVKNPAERAQIQKRYNLDKEDADELANLDKYEIMAISKNHPWIAYDSYGRRRVMRNRMFRGKMVPPLNKHL